MNYALIALAVLVVAPLGCHYGGRLYDHLWVGGR